MIAEYSLAQRITGRVRQKFYSFCVFVSACYIFVQIYYKVSKSLNISGYFFFFLIREGKLKIKNLTGFVNRRHLKNNQLLMKYSSCS